MVYVRGTEVAAGIREKLDAYKGLSRDVVILFQPYII